MKDDKKDDRQTVKTGTLNKKIFYKVESSFLIGSFINHKTKETFSAVGNMMSPQVGMTYKLTGELKENGNYGEQLNFTMFETITPKDTNGIFKYIVRIAKYVGPTVGNALVDEFGVDTLTVMKNEPKKIALIKGITHERALEIQATLIDNEKTEAITVELMSILNIPGLRKNLPSELINKFGSNAAELVKKNPYILTSFTGISFILADRVAIDIGTDPRSIERKKAASCHIIRESMMQGNIWIEERDLIQETALLIGVMNCDEGVKVLLGEEILVNKTHSLNPFRTVITWYTFADEAYREEKIAKKLVEIMLNEPLLETANGGYSNAI